MIERPTITDTATIRAATATAVRLRERRMSRGARRATTGRPRLAQPRPCMAATSTGGISRAAPISRANSPAKAGTRPLLCQRSNSTPRPPLKRAARRNQGSSRCQLASRLERCRVIWGGVAIASQAGRAEASSAEATPTSIPLARVNPDRLICRTETTK